MDGIPKIFHFGHEGDYSVMVLEQLGPTLMALFEFCEKKFSEATVAMIGIQCLDRLELIHSRNFIHRDIKPENFLIGPQKREELIYLIDFGIAKRYRDPATNVHISFKKNKGQLGTLRYSSVNATKGSE